MTPKEIEFLISEQKTKLDSSVNELLALLACHDPLELISRYVFHNLVRSVDAPNDDGRNEAGVEYLISLALAQPRQGVPKYPSPDEIQKCLDLVDSIFWSARICYGMGKAVKSDGLGPKAELSSMLQQNTLNIRGDGFYHHTRQRFEDVLSSQSEFMKDRFGFDIVDFYAFLDRVEEEINARIEIESEKKQRPIQEILQTVSENFKEVISASSTEENQNEALNSIREKYKDRFFAAKETFDKFGGADIFCWQPKTDTECAILQRLSCSFGENSDFLSSFPKSPGWPLNSSVFTRKPIISCDGNFYIFHLQFLGRNAFSLFRQLIEEEDAKIGKRLLKSRDNYTENESLKLIGGILPGCQTFQNLFYSIRSAEGEIWAEVDGVIVYDDNLIIIEAKSHGFSPAAKRGAPSFTEDIAESLGQSFRQATRLREEIGKRDHIDLEDERGNVVTTLRRTDFERYFLISVTFDLLPVASVRLPLVKQLGLIFGDDWPWVICLDDLRVVTHILDRPSLFLHYIMRRVRINTFPKFHASDELDYMMNYIDTGLFMDHDSRFDEADSVTLMDHTEPLVRYYKYVLGIVSSGKKPKVRLTPAMKEYLDLLESKRPPHFSTAAIELLDYDDKSRADLLQQRTGLLVRLRKVDKALFAGSVCHETNSIYGFCLVRDIESWQRTAVDMFQNKSMVEAGVGRGVLIIIQPPIAAGKFSIKTFNTVQKVRQQ